MNSLENFIIDNIKIKVKHIYHLEIDRKNLEESLYLCDNLSIGHYTFKCFNLAKELKSSPLNIANSLLDYFFNMDLFDSVNAVNGYLNFKIKVNHLAQESYSIPNSFNEINLSKKVVIEYSQPNTHKELHVGHMRNLCLGNSLCRIKSYLGYDVISATYPGDVGTHVAKCLWYIKNRYIGNLPSHNKGEWLGNIYAKANAALLDENNDPEIAKENKAELTLILKEIEAKSGSYYQLWLVTREWSLELMRSIYSWADVTFDKWYFESEVDKPSIELCNSLFEKGLLIKSDGAIGMDLRDLDLGFCMLIKSDGTGLYATKDIELAKVKHDNFNPDQSIYVVDNRQSFHFEQVFNVLERIGFEDSKKCVHLKYEMVELPDGAMSSRKGNIIPISSLINRMEETIKDKYLSKNCDWNNDEIDKVASQIANGAIKYGMLKFDPNKKIIFNFDDWLRIDGDTGPYIQYSATRANSILNNNADFNLDTVDNFDFTYCNDIEIELLVKLLSFDNSVRKANQLNKPSIIANYSYELAQIFNKFYANINIRHIDNIDEKIQKLILVKNFYLRIGICLNLLGIVIPSRM
ncbi:TPA: arginine--tRNA ligase [Vibrio vulnificus]